jgi:HPt (histidine-containing phosphotransfer) domain-containing protein
MKFETQGRYSMTLTSGTLLPHSHDPWLVALSVLIAVAAAYAGQDTGVVEADKLALLQEAVGEAFTEIVLTFLKDTPRRLTGMREALAAGDRQRLQLEAHTLKGTSATFGAQAISALCGHLDQDAFTAESGYAGSLISSIESGFRRVHRHLTAELSEAA